jgi:uncharacterized membrane protein
MVLALLGINFDTTGVLSSLLGGIGNLFISFFAYLLNEVGNLITWLISLIPQLPVWQATYPSISSAISYVLQTLAPMMAAWNYYVCLNLWITLLFVGITTEGALAVWKVIRWILTHIPIVGGGE